MVKIKGKKGKRERKKTKPQRAKKEKTGSSTDRAELSKVLNGHVESVLPILSDEVISEEKGIVFVEGQSPNS